MELDNLLFYLGHSAFYIKAKDCTIFIDPFRISDSVKERADLILITHAHFDHCSRADINRVMKKDAKIIAAPNCLKAGEYGDITVAEPGFKTSFKDVGIEAVPAYNISTEKQQFHPKANHGVGYVVDVDGMRIYHAGDTDLIPEMSELKDIYAALIPVGGKFTMTVDEAIEADRIIKPRFFVPMHYKSLLGVEGSKKAEERLMNALDNCHILKEMQEPAYSF